MVQTSTSDGLTRATTSTSDGLTRATTSTSDGLTRATTSTSDGLTRAKTSIVPEEAERFGKLASDWWDPAGASAMLHKLNPVRLKYLRDQIDQHWQCDECSRTPLTGKSAL